MLIGEGLCNKRNVDRPEIQVYQIKGLDQVLYRIPHSRNLLIGKKSKGALFSVREFHGTDSISNSRSLGIESLVKVRLAKKGIFVHRILHTWERRHVAKTT